VQLVYRVFNVPKLESLTQPPSAWHAKGQPLPAMLQDASSLVLATALLACTAPLGSDGGAGGPRVVKYTPVDPGVMQSEFDASRRARGTDPIGIDQLNAWWEER
jgi:hypothetical protein